MSSNAMRPKKAQSLKPPYKRALTLEELAAMPDEYIDYSDIPEVDEAFWQNARWEGPDERKQRISRAYVESKRQ